MHQMVLLRECQQHDFYVAQASVPFKAFAFILGKKNPMNLEVTIIVIYIPLSCKSKWLKSQIK